MVRKSGAAEDQITRMRRRIDASRDIVAENRVFFPEFFGGLVGIHQDITKEVKVNEEERRYG